METTVGIRAFKARLSEYMQQVKDGQSLIITEHRKPVGRILPVATSLEDRIEELRKDGLVEWSGFHRLPVNEPLVARADALVCEHNLRGNDAIHLAGALTWQELLDVPVTLVTYDRELAEAARASGMAVLP